MLKLNFEFRKGIFFIRLIGDLNRETYHEIEKELKSLIEDNLFRYIVVNTNHLKTIDMDGLNYLTKIYYLTRECHSNLIICDKSKIFNVLLNNNVPLIDSELEVL